jgi:general stress protein 26
MAESIDFAMLITKLGERPFHAIPMSTKKVDESGNIWFLSGKDSNHNRNILVDSQVQLIYSDPGDMEFLCLFGEVTITTDKAVIQELYGKADDLWFEGEDDPNVSALRFKPQTAQYWDNKNSKFVTLFKMGVGMISGKQPDISETGSLKV